MFDVTNPAHVITLRSRLSDERLSSYDQLTGGQHAETLSLYERNLLAHHKAIYRRDLEADYADLLFVVGAICQRARAWVDQTSTIGLVLAQRPAMVSPN